MLTKLDKGSMEGTHIFPLAPTFYLDRPRVHDYNLEQTARLLITGHHCPLQRTAHQSSGPNFRADLPEILRLGHN